MGILKSLFMLGKLFVVQVEEVIDEVQGVCMLEQYICDVKVELDKVGKFRVDLLVWVKLSYDKLNDLCECKVSFEIWVLVVM